jgi:hypothetical protein
VGVHLLGAVGALVVALDGESAAGGNSTGVAVIAAVSIVSGYVLLAALWWFVFREQARQRRGRGRGRGRED